MKTTYLIIGASAAGINALHTLRRLEPTSTVTIISTEAEKPYNKCLLVDFLGNSRTLDDIRIGREYTDPYTTVMLGTAVTALHPAEKKVSLETGATITYKKLLLAFGVAPRTLAHANTLEGVYSWYTMHSALCIKDYITKHYVPSAVVIGAGLNGVECAAALTQLGIACTIIEQREHILPAVADRTTTERIATLLRQHGVEVLCNQTVEKITHTDGTATGVQLSNEHVIHAPLVITALGTQPRSALLDNAGILTSDAGITTNNYLQTNYDTVYAAGDCCAVYDTAQKKQMPSRTWPDAVKQGICAAYAMAEKERAYEGTVVNYHTTVFDQDFVL